MHKIDKIPLSWYFVLSSSKDIMINRSIRILPFPALYTFTPEFIIHIKSIPDDVIEYSDSEIAWMNRALENLDDFEKFSEKETVIIKTYKYRIRTKKFRIRLCSPEIIALRRKQIQSQLETALSHQKTP